MATSYHHDGRDFSEKGEFGVVRRRNVIDLNKHYNKNTRSRKENPLKALYHYFYVPGMANLAGGFPHPSNFPINTLSASILSPTPPSSTPKVPRNFSLLTRSRAAQNHIKIPLLDVTTPQPLAKIDLATALQYGRAQGLAPLTEFLTTFTIHHLHQNKIPYQAAVLPTCGSTDGFNKVVGLIAERGDTMLVEEWVYPNSVVTIQPLGIETASVKMDEQGMCPDSLRDVLENWDENVKGSRKPSFMYTVTVGHNPTGRSTPLERRRKIYDICSEHDVIIIEDEPYWHLQYPVSPPPPDVPFLASLVPSFITIDVDCGRVIRLDTLSKTIAPGCRMGWVTAHPDIIEKLAASAEASTQQPSGFTQALVAQLLVREWGMDGWIQWIESLRGLYQARMEKQLSILKDSQWLETVGEGKDEDEHERRTCQILEIERPAGGMFIWLRVLLQNHPAFEMWMARGHTRREMLMKVWMFVADGWMSLPCPGEIFASTEEIRQGCEYFRFCFAAIEEDELVPTTERWAVGARKFWELSVDEIEAVGGGDKEKTMMRDLREGVGMLELGMGC